MATASKLLHWIIFLTFLGLLLTAVSANILFSKEAIMESFNFSLPAIGVEIAPSDQLFMARIERRFTWEIHFWLGVFLMTAVFFRFVLFLRSRKRNRFLNLFTFFLITVIFASGLPLYMRIYFDIPADIQQFARDIHYYGALFTMLFVIAHIGWVIYLENGKRKGVLSSMFYFRGKFFLFAFFVVSGTFSQTLYASEWEKDPDYQRAVAYMEGKIGIQRSSKTIKNCPYAKCDEVADEVNRNVKTINIKTKNYPRMVAHFQKSVEKGNPLAAKTLAKFLIGRIDYRSKIPDKTLLKIGERDTGMGYEAYLSLARKSLRMAADAKDCYSMYKLAEFYRNGWMGFAKDNTVACKYYQAVLEHCDRKSFFYIMSEAKVQ